jgi:two-component system, response regulator RegA
MLPAQIQLSAPEYAVVDMRFHEGCGLDVISLLKQQRPEVSAIILTGYGNIATAVKAVKLGAIDYLLKPADADDIISTLLAPRGRKAKAPSRPTSADRVRWEHIHHVFEVSGRNVSETARRLNMPRASTEDLTSLAAI